jgi:hypothetical protein
MERLASFLFASEAVAFRTALTLDQAVASLRSATAQPSFRSLPQEAAIGTVCGTKVSLRRTIPSFDNSFMTFFVGRFSVESGETVLDGAFTVHWMMKVMMGLWVGFIALWSLPALFNATANRAGAWFFPLAGLGMLLVAVAVVRVARWRGRHDQQFLVDLIETSLGGNTEDNVGSTFL